ncbi:MAG TPA: hypothetical protein VE863_15500 [Pyrinomonadaceae bacterium]|jgi:hypothetical protein|nr:hypothetical protein [Pyrinomonadaceae bacterium]
MRIKKFTVITSVLIVAIAATTAVSQTPAKDGGTRPIIKEKPEPTLPISIKKASEFSIVLHAMFRADGTVTDITRYKVVPEKPDGMSPNEIDSLTACAVEAAMKIRFIPAARNGHAVSMWMEVEYRFGPSEAGATSNESEDKHNAGLLSKSAEPTNDKDRPLVMQHTPDPILPVDLDLKIELAVTLKVEFKKDGKVGKIEVLSSRVPASMSAKMIASLEQATMDAAGRIRFTPAIKDGKRVSQWYLLEYTFRREDQRRYSNWRHELIA